MQKDFRGIWSNRFMRKWRFCLQALWTFHARFKAYFWGVKIGCNNRFYGKIHFQRIQNSSIEIGDNCKFRSATWANLAGINRPCILSTLKQGAIIKIGKGSGFSGTVIGAATSIVIGDNVLCGVNTTITDTDWHSIDRCQGDKIEKISTSPVKIDDDVWLGMNVVVLKGVTIGKGAIVSANSVVTSDVNMNTLVGGNPAKIIRNLN